MIEKMILINKSLNQTNERLKKSTQDMKNAENRMMSLFIYVIVGFFCLFLPFSAILLFNVGKGSVLLDLIVQATLVSLILTVVYMPVLRYKWMKAYSEILYLKDRKKKIKFAMEIKNSNIDQLFKGVKKLAENNEVNLLDKSYIEKILLLKDKKIRSNKKISLDSQIKEIETNELNKEIKLEYCILND